MCAVEEQATDDQGGQLQVLFCQFFMFSQSRMKLATSAGTGR
jgi:hypothetical protein